MYVEFTEQVPGSVAVSRGERVMPESPHVGDVVSVLIEGKPTPCRVVGREWMGVGAGGIYTEPGPDLIVQVTQISQVATGGSDGETEG